MLLTQLDMPAARYAFALLATGEICQKREGFILYRMGAKRQYIEFEQSENISSGRSRHIDKRKNKSKNRRMSPFTLAFLIERRAHHFFLFFASRIYKNLKFTSVNFRQLLPCFLAKRRRLDRVEAHATVPIG